MRRPAVLRFTLALCLTAAALLGPALVGPVRSALAAPGTETAQVATAAEAWYRPPPTCASPLGCGPAAALPSEFAPGTLHVSVAGGVERTRSYVTLDLSVLPAGTVPVGGVATLPIATGPNDGTRAPETAKVRLCLVTGAVVDGVEGDSGEPPAVDCAAAASPATFVPAADPEPAALVVDLAPFVAAWAGGAPMQGFAVVPAEGVPPTDSWHVAFSQRDRMAEGVRPVTASLTFGSGAAASDAFDLFPTSPGSTLPPASSSFDSGFPATTGSDLGFSSLPPTAPLTGGLPSAPAAEVPGPEVAEQPAAEPVAAGPFVTLGGFAYPVVFLLPLLLAGVFAWAGRALTRDLVPSAGLPTA